MMARVARYGSEELFDGTRADLLARRPQRRLLRRPRRFDRGLRRRRARPAAGLPRPARAPVLRRAQSLQRARGPRQRARRRADSAAARQARRLPPARLDRARHRRDRHARVHPAPRRPDPPRARRRRRDRPGAHRRHLAPGSVPEQERLSAPPARHRAGRRSGRLPRLLLAQRSRPARRDRARPPRAEEPVARADGRRPRTHRDLRPRAGVRPRRRRRRSGGPRGRGLRRVGGAAHDRHRKRRARRPGRDELEDRELPRLSDRHLGPGARRPRTGAGAEVRRATRALARGRRPRLRHDAVPAAARRRRTGPRPRDRRRHRRALSQARRCRRRALRRRRHLLRGDRDGSGPVRAAPRLSWSAAATRPARRPLPRPDRAARAHAGARRRPRGDDVGLPRAADRAVPIGSRCTYMRDHCARRQRSPRERHLGRARARRDDAPGERGLRHDRRRAEHAVGERLPGARRARVRAHRRERGRRRGFAVRDFAGRRLRGRRRRSGSVKRVASGVGEGSVVVQSVHRFLQPTG